MGNAQKPRKIGESDEEYRNGLLPESGTYLNGNRVLDENGDIDWETYEDTSVDFAEDFNEATQRWKADEEAEALAG